MFIIGQNPVILQAMGQVPFNPGTTSVPMIRDDLESLLSSAVDRLISEGFLPAGLPRPEVSEPRDPSHGDFACNFALVAAKPSGKPPREVGEKLAALLGGDLIESVEVAGPGFLNLRLKPGVLGRYVASIASEGPAYARSNPAKPLKINVEFVSVNPNGPITVGSGRGAAFGSVLCNVLEAAGHTVHREFYVNDGVNSEQMRLFGLSVAALAAGQPVPEKGYKGDYVQVVADEIRATESDPPSDPAWWQERSQDLMVNRHREDLLTFGVRFDTWFSEQTLHDQGLVAKAIAELEGKGIADENPTRTVLKLARGGAIEEVKREEQPVDEDDAAEGTSNTLWLRSTKLGDDMDRVLRRKDGRPTYISSDVAYHADKFNRPEGCDKLITILGPDHHGYIGRLTAVVAALKMKAANAGSQQELSDHDALIYTSAAERDACQAALAKAREELQVVIFQIVRFLKDGEPAPMRKRDGNIYALIDLVDEIGTIMEPEASLEARRKIGKDVTRFFYLMRSHDTHMDFDIDAATKRSDENPVFYVQYAHARICSILRKAAEQGLAPVGDGKLLTHTREIALIKRICDLPWEVARCAEDMGVHRLTTYAQDLARSFHLFYDACRVIQPEERELTGDRLLLCQATQTALLAVFQLLGIEAPETM